MKYIKNYKLKKLNIFSSASLILLASCASGYTNGSLDEKRPGIFINNSSASGGCIWTYDDASKKTSIGVIEGSEIWFGGRNSGQGGLPSVAELGGASSIVCGTGDKAFQTSRALFYGTDAHAGSVSLTLGGELFVNGGNLGLGGGAANRAMRIGSLATLNTNSGIRSLAIGAGDQATVASGADSIAIGTNAQAIHEGSVALGSGSKTIDVVATTSILINNKNHAVAGTNLAGTVSVGNAGAERTITNVGAGRVNALSTDAVNGSQLHITNQEIAGLSQEVAKVEDRLEDESTKNRIYTDQQVSKVAATAAQNDQQVLKEANAYTDGKVAQVNSRVDVNSEAISNNSQQIEQLKGGVAKADESNVKYDVNEDGTKRNSLTLEGSSKNTQVTIKNVAAGVDRTDAANVGQLEDRLKDESTKNRIYTDQEISKLATTAAQNDQKVLKEANVYTDDKVAQVNSRVDANGAAINNNSQKIEQLEAGIDATNSSAVKYDLNDDGTKKNTVSLHGGDENAAVTVSNVAAGVNGTDAVNVDQLEGRLKDESTNNRSHTDQRVAEVKAHADAADHQLNRDIQENDAEILATNQSLDKTNEKLDEVDTFSVKYGQNEDGRKNNVIALQGGDPNAPVLLENIASGVKTNDAVNVGQLKDSIEAVSKKAHSYTDERIAHTRDYVDQKTAATLGQANAYTDEKFGQLSGEIVATRKEARQAAAIGLAAASLRYDDRPGKLSVAAGGGFWRGESAFSAGMGYTNDEGKVRANVSATHAGGHIGVGAGISYTFN